MGSCMSKSSSSPSSISTRPTQNAAKGPKLQKPSGYTGQGRRLGDGGAPTPNAQSRPSNGEMTGLISDDKIAEDARARAALAAQNRSSSAGGGGVAGVSKPKGKLGKQLDNELKKGKNALLMDQALERQAERKNEKLVFD